MQKGLVFVREQSGSVPPPDPGVPRDPAPPAAYRHWRLERDGWVLWHSNTCMADNRPLSENEADDRLKAALNALGEARGVTVFSRYSINCSPQGAFAYFIGPHIGRR